MKCIPMRVWIGTMLFMSCFTNYMLRANITVSVGEMVKARNVSAKANACARNSTPIQSKSGHEGEFEWTQNEQGQIIAAYFYGTMVSFFPGGTLAEWLGAVNVIAFTSLVSGILTIFSPHLAKLGGFIGTFTVRFVIGVLGGPVYPAVNVLIARWAPPVEKGRFLATLLGNTIGVVITWLMVGYTTAQWGWEAGFYSVGVFMLVFTLVFYFVTTDTPQKHRWISDEERDYILESQGGTVSTQKKIPPYGKIFTSVYFISVVVAQFGNLWALNLMITFAPKYFKETLGYNLKEAVVFAALPYLSRLIGSQAFGIIGDSMRKREVFSTLTRLRKFFVIFSHYIPAVCFCFIYVAECNWVAVLSLLVINQGLNGAVVVGHLVMCQDLSPNFAGTLYGIMNLIGSTTGFFVPSINGAILSAMKEQPILAASIIYLIGGGVLIICATIFVCFGRAEIQPWNTIEKKEDKPA